MKLFTVDLSPYASRCRLQIYAKGLAVDFMSPPGGLSSTEYKAINPTGRVPALVLDDAAKTVIPESQVICEYLEDRFREPALRPADPVARARMRLVARFVDLYLAPALAPIFAQANPKTRDAQALAKGFQEAGPVFDALQGFLSPGGFAVGESLTLADCALLPFLHFSMRGFPVLGGTEPTVGRPRLAAWWESVQKHDAVVRVQTELDAALAEYMAGFS